MLKKFAFLFLTVFFLSSPLFLAHAQEFFLTQEESVSLPAPTPQPLFAPDQLLIQYDPSLPTTQVSTLSLGASSTNSDLNQISSLSKNISHLTVNDQNFALLTLKPDQDLFTTLTDLQENNDAIQTVGLNFYYYPQSPSPSPITPQSPNVDTTDPLLPNLWALDLINLGPAWEYSKGAGATVAVIDTGVDFNHQDLATAKWNGLRPNGSNCTKGNCSNGGYSFYNAGLEKNTPQPHSAHDYHGTHVAGTIGARENSLGIVGVAPQSAVMGVNAISYRSTFTDFDVAKGIIFARENGAQVMNLSLGITLDFAELSQELGYTVNCSNIGSIVTSTYTLYATALNNYDGILAIAAGNEDTELSLSSPQAISIPNQFGSNPCNLWTPLPQIISVGAINENDQWGFIQAGDGYGSNYGDGVNLYAPGNAILSSASYDASYYGEAYSLYTQAIENNEAPLLLNDLLNHASYGYNYRTTNYYANTIQSATVGQKPSGFKNLSEVNSDFGPYSLYTTKQPCLGKNTDFCQAIGQDTKMLLPTSNTALTSLNQTPFGSAIATNKFPFDKDNLNLRITLACETSATDTFKIYLGNVGNIELISHPLISEVNNQGYLNGELLGYLAANQGTHPLPEGLTIVPIGSSGTYTDNLYLVALSYNLDKLSLRYNSDAHYVFGQTEIAVVFEWLPGNISASQLGCAILSASANQYDLLSSTTAYKSIPGTSMAAPHVAGVAALLKSAFPTATHTQIKSALITGSDTITINPENTGNQNVKRLNAGKAMCALAQAMPTDPLALNLTAPPQDSPWLNTDPPTITGTITGGTVDCDQAANNYTINYALTDSTATPDTWQTHNTSSRDFSFSPGTLPSSQTTHYLHLKASDGTHQVTPFYLPLQIDFQPPSPFTLNRASDTLWAKQATASITVQDDISGLSKLFFRWNSSDNVTGTNCTGLGGNSIQVSGTNLFTSSPLTPDAQGSNTLYACAQDIAGNTTALGPQTYLYDSIKPLRINPDITSPNSEGTRSATITLQDVTSGLAHAFYRFDSDTNVSTNNCSGAGAIPLTGFTIGDTASWTSPTITIATPSDTLHVCAQDVAGNVRSTSDPPDEDPPPPTDPPDEDPQQPPAPPSSNNSGSHKKSGGGGTSQPKPPGCSDSAPRAPYLFQINSINTKTALFFTPETGPKSAYFVAYGLTPDSLDYGYSFATGDDHGVNIALVNELAPGTTYYYRLRAQNGCMPGDWSNTLAATTSKNANLVRVHYANSDHVNSYQKR